MRFAEPMIETTSRLLFYHAAERGSGFTIWSVPCFDQCRRARKFGANRVEAQVSYGLARSCVWCGCQSRRRLCHWQVHIDSDNRAAPLRTSGGTAKLAREGGPLSRGGYAISWRRALRRDGRRGWWYLGGLCSMTSGPFEEQRRRTAVVE